MSTAGGSTLALRRSSPFGSSRWPWDSWRYRVPTSWLISIELQQNPGHLHHDRPANHAPVDLRRHHRHLADSPHRLDGDPATARVPDTAVLRYEQPDPPHVLAIVPAKDEEANLADCLASVSRQTYPNLEVLVVNDRSTDRTGEIARQFASEDSGSDCSRSTISRPDGPARPTRCTPPPRDREPIGSGSSTPTRYMPPMRSPS